MTTSDRAGSEERLRPYIDDVNAGWHLDDDGVVVYHDTLPDYLIAIRAALAATPTQSGAEGPAALRKLALEIASFDQVRYSKNKAAIEEQWADVMDALAAALRSGAEVAAAPGLDVDEKMLRWVAAQPIGFGDWACRDCRPDSDMIVDDFRCMVHEARARLTAKP